jgi:hypothetical protein
MLVILGIVLYVTAKQNQITAPRWVHAAQRYADNKQTQKNAEEISK